jgi:hypothetical protein
MIVGYARVSTDGQSLDHQQAALREAGCAKVFAEKQSGAKTDSLSLQRPSLRLAMAIHWLSVSLIGLHDQLAICSTPSTQSARLAQRSNR